ncbi:MAG TPA: S24/S26 family peptidase [Terriglobales bacterium]|nr:S24/S26 family peptidase [Terriglobales bacterium]
MPQDCPSHTPKSLLALQVLRDFGEVCIRATGTSMLPAVWPGDLLVVQATPIELVRPGDLVLYTRQERWFVHRVVTATSSPSATSLSTRGDALSEVDPPVSYDEMLGRVTVIRRAGRSIAPRLRPRAIPRWAGWLLYYADQMNQRVRRRLLRVTRRHPDGVPA